MKRSKFIAVCVVLVMMLCGTAWSEELTKTDKFEISGSFDKAVQNGTCLCATRRGHVDPVLSSQGEWPNSLLGKIIIHRDISVFEEYS